MTYDGFNIRIFGREQLPIEEVVGIVRNLPKPYSVNVSLDPNSIGVLKGKLDDRCTLHQPSKDRIIDYLLDNDIRGVFGDLTLNFGGDITDKGHVDVSLTALTPLGQADELYDSIRDELKRKNIGTWRYLAAITHKGGEKGRLDRRVFDYGKIVVSRLMPIGTEQDYFIVPSGLSDNPSIMRRDDFLKSLDDLIQRNCNAYNLLRSKIK